MSVIPPQPIEIEKTIVELYDIAVATSKTLKQKPTDQELLTMYGMFKYVKEGNAAGDAPSIIWNMSGNYKWHEWKKYDNFEVDAVRTSYIAFVNTLVATYGVV